MEQLRNTCEKQLKKEVPIVFATNDKYAPYVGVAIESIIQNSSPGNHYIIFILHCGLSEINCGLLESFSKKNLKVSCINIAETHKDKMHLFFERAHFSKETFFRFFISEEISQYDKVIYLDSDIAVCCDIAELMNVDMKNNLIAGVKDTFFKLIFQSTDYCIPINPDNYINAGIILINNKQWQEEKVADKCFDLLKNTPASKLQFLDQDIINIVCENRITYLDETWNFMWHMVYGNPKDIEYCADLVERIGDTYKILHFSSVLKPWIRPELPLSAIFWNYAKNTVYFNIILNRFVEAEQCERKKLIKQLKRIKKSKSYRMGEMLAKPIRIMRSIVLKKTSDPMNHCYN